jgi:hypothetical protein
MRDLNTFKIFQVERRWKLRKRRDNNHQISCGEEIGLLDQCPVNKGSVEEKNISHAFDLSAEDHPSSDHEKVHKL